MNAEKLHNLHALLQLKLSIERARAHPVLAQVTQLRAQRKKVDELDQTAKQSENMEQLSRFGGDVIWNVWLERQKRELDFQLARSLADQREALYQVSRSQGLCDVMEALNARNDIDWRMNQDKRTQEELTLAALILAQTRFSK